MSALKDLVGQKFGRLTVIARAENDKDGKVQWVCRCDCENLCIVRRTSLVSGDTTTCGRHPKYKDLADCHFGYLRVISFHHSNKKNTYWLCECLLCGNHCVVSGIHLKSGGTKSCGCLRQKKATERATTHGMRYTREYCEWLSMVQRCTNPKHKNYKEYGGRDIKVCERWRVFDNFNADMKAKFPDFGKPGKSIDRIDNDGDYTIENVRVADAKTQNRNKRNNIIVAYNNIEMTLAEAAELSGIGYSTLRKRYHAGDRGECLFRPVKSRRK